MFPMKQSMESFCARSSAAASDPSTPASPVLQGEQPANRHHQAATGGDVGAGRGPHGHPTAPLQGRDLGTDRAGSGPSRKDAVLGQDSRGGPGGAAKL